MSFFQCRMRVSLIKVLIKTSEHHLISAQDESVFGWCWLTSNVRRRSQFIFNNVGICMGWASSFGWNMLLCADLRSDLWFPMLWLIMRFVEREFDLRSVQKGNFCQHWIPPPVDLYQTDGIEGETDYWRRHQVWCLLWSDPWGESIDKPYWSKPLISNVSQAPKVL